MENRALPLWRATETRILAGTKGVPAGGLMSAAGQGQGQKGQAMLVGVMALLLLTASILSGLRYIGPKVALHELQQTPKLQEEVIQKALYAFVAKNYRLPCPADGSAPQNGTGTLGSVHTADGIENCALGNGNLNSGVVPWKTLGLQYTDIIDGYGSRMGYAVSSALTAATGPFKTQVPPQGTLTGDAIAVKTCTGLNVCTPLSAPGDPAGVYAYALISFGPDKAGARIQSGTQIAPPPLNAAEYANSQAAAFQSGGSGFNIYTPCSRPVCTPTVNLTKLYDDIVVYETSHDICAKLNKAGQNEQAWSAICSPSASGGAGSGSGSGNSPSATLNLGTAAAAANPTAGFTNTYSCGGSANFCPGSSNAGSLSNTGSYVGGGTGSGAFTPGGNAATMVGNLGTASVQDPVANSGISIGNNNGQSGGSGDWIGPDTLNACPQCYGSSWTQNYMVPTQTLAFTFTHAYQSYAFADYLVDGGMEVQVDGYQAHVFSFTGTVSAGSAAVAASAGLQGVAPGQFIMGTGVAGGATVVSVVPGGSGTIVTMSAAATANAAGTTLYTVDNSFLVTTPLQANVAQYTVSGTGPNLTTQQSQIIGLAAGQNVTGIGIPAGTTIASVSSINQATAQAVITLSQAPAVTSTQPVPLTITPWVHVGTNILSNGSATNINVATMVTGQWTAGSTAVTSVSSTTNLAVGQSVAGAGIQPGTTIAAIGANAITLSLAPTISSQIPAVKTGSGSDPAVPAIGPLYVGEGEVVATPITGTVTTGSSTVTAVSSTVGLTSTKPIAGQYIPQGTTIQTLPAAGATTLSLSQGATASGTVTLFPSNRRPVTDITGTVTNGSNTIANVSYTTGLAVGQSITGVGVPPGSTIKTIAASSLTISQNATATATEPLYFQTQISAISGNIENGSAAIDSVSPTTGLAPGEFLEDPLIPAGTTIDSITGQTVILGAEATGTQAGASLIAGFSPPLSPALINGTVQSGFATITDVSPGGLPSVGQAITGTGIPAGAMVSAVDGGNAGTQPTITMSRVANGGSLESLFTTFPACPGPASAINGQPFYGLYGSPLTEVGNIAIATPQDQQPDAPFTQHPGAATAALLPAQIWPQPATGGTGLPSATSNPNSLSGNYTDQRDNQFTNRDFTDTYGTVLPFNVLVFQVLPYVYTNGAAACTGSTAGTATYPACPYGNINTYRYGMLFEGINACYTDIYTADCAFTPGTDEWANPPVTVTQDCDQRPS